MSEANTPASTRQVWYKVAGLDELPENRVKSVTCGVETICLTHYQGQYAALSNKCPHQGGPLGEGSIENGWLRCPWHGWDYNPLTGRSPGEFDDGVDTFPIEVREDGVYVAFEEEAPHVRTASDVMAETMVNWGVRQVWGMVGHSNLGLADALRVQEQAGNLSYYGIRHEGAAAFACSAYGKLTGRPAACLAIAGPGATNLLTGLWDANVDRSPVLALTGQVDTQVLGPGRLPGDRPGGRLRQGGAVEPAGAALLEARRADEPGVQERHPQSRRLPPDLPRRGAGVAGGRRRQGRGAPRPHHPARHRAAPKPSDDAVALLAEVEAAGDHRRPRRPLRHAGGHRAGRVSSARRSSPPSRARA